jgi:hypothetical protein
MGSGLASKAPESALWKGEAEPRYRRFLVRYPGVTFDSHCRSDTIGLHPIR